MEKELTKYWVGQMIKFAAIVLVIALAVAGVAKYLIAMVG